MGSETFIADDQLRERIHTRLNSFERKVSNQPDLRPAAVSLVLVSAEDNDSACVLLTRRASKLKRHGGQYALPGGRVDQGEDDESAALRELDEEVGLHLGRDRVLGVLDDFPTRSGFRITPFVLWGGNVTELQPSPDEVDAVFRIPFSELNVPEVPHLEYIPESENPVLSAHLPTLGHEVYAPTAAILYQFREIALRGNDTRVAHFEQPLFAWK